MRDFIRSGTKSLSLLALAALTACGGGSDGDSSTYNAEIRRTAMGVPHSAQNFPRETVPHDGQAVPALEAFDMRGKIGGGDNLTGEQAAVRCAEKTGGR